jgi:hypothetical protein
MPKREPTSAELKQLLDENDALRAELAQLKHKSLTTKGCPSRRSGLRLIFQPISNPAVNDWPLVASRTEIEKVRPFCL